MAKEKPIPAVHDLRKDLVGNIYRGSDNNLYYIENICITNVHHRTSYPNEIPVCFLLNITTGNSRSFPLEILYDLRERVDRDSLSYDEKERLSHFIKSFIPETPEFQGEYRHRKSKLEETH